MSTWPRFEIYRVTHKDTPFEHERGWRLRLKTRNGKIICQGEGYKQRAKCLAACEIINPNYSIVEVQEDD